MATDKGLPTEQGGKAMEKQKKPGKGMRAALICTALGVCLVAAAVFIVQAVEKDRQEKEARRQAIINSGVIHRGIVIHDAPVGGMDMAAAQKAAHEAEARIRKSIRFTLTFEGEEYPAAAQDFGLAFNTKEALNEAMNTGREGTLNELDALLEDLAANGRVIPITYRADEAAVRAYVAGLAQKANREPVNARFDTPVNPKELTDEQKKSEKFVLAASATTAEERMTFAKEEPGAALDEQALFEAIMAMLEAGKFSDMALPMVRVEPEITLENIQSKIVLRGTASTSYAKSPYNRATRVFNIRKSVSLINGTVVEPGAVFSANDALGNRTYAAGWRPAPAIVGGRTEDQAGGGVCQVSTTLYMCVLKSDLEVVHRQGHSARLSYAPGGLDATIDSGRIDFQWKNNTDAPIYVFAWVNTEKKTLHFEIYGEPFPDEFDEIELSSRRVSAVSPPGPMQYTVDYSKQPGYKEVYVARKSGSIWEATATYLKNGEQVKTKKVARTTYRAYAGETIIGPEPAYYYTYSY